MEYINPRETETYKTKKQAYSQMSDSQLILATLLELHRDMGYKNALEFPGRTPRPEDYVLEDEIRERLVKEKG